MNKKIRTALISVFYKTGLENICRLLNSQGVILYSTGGTEEYIKGLELPVVPVEKLTSYPSILGGRVKTLHPSVFGGILGKRNDDSHVKDMEQFGIPGIDLVIVDLYPFEETVAATDDEKLIIEKIDIGGPSMIRAAAKNYADVMVVADKNDYVRLEQILSAQNGESSLEQRREFAARAFEIVAHYDVAISKFFNPGKGSFFQTSYFPARTMRYGENPHQAASFYGRPGVLFDQLHGKELSYNNLIDTDSAMQLAADFSSLDDASPLFAIIKHTNVCGMAQRDTVKESWDAALAGDPESAFGGVLICTASIDKLTASAINEIFFEVLIAPSFDEYALRIQQTKKNRILLKTLAKGNNKSNNSGSVMFRSLLNGVIVQDIDRTNFSEWKETGGRDTTALEKSDLLFANIICKHLKSNAIALVKNKQLVGKGCGQTSRIDSLRQAIEKARQFNFDLVDAVMASDAFFPFDDCLKLGHEAGISAFIQPGGSIRDSDSVSYCKENNLAMVMTSMRHFKH